MVFDIFPEYKEKLKKADFVTFHKHFWNEKQNQLEFMENVGKKLGIV